MARHGKYYLLPDKQDDKEPTVISIPKSSTLHEAKVEATMYYIEYGVECAILQLVWTTEE